MRESDFDIQHWTFDIRHSFPLRPEAGRVAGRVAGGNRRDHLARACSSCWEVEMHSILGGALGSSMRWSARSTTVATLAK